MEARETKPDCPGARQIITFITVYEYSITTKDKMLYLELHLPSNRRYITHCQKHIFMCKLFLFFFFLQVNLSTSNDIDPYNSKEVIKYLKDNLYLYALLGHMSLKESLPVVDILPIINEETESVEDDDSLEAAVDDLEHKEEKISDVEKDEVADHSFDRSEPFIKYHALDYTVGNSELVTKNLLDMGEKNLSFVSNVYTSEQNLSNSEYHAAQTDVMINNDDKLPLKDTKFISFNEDCTLGKNSGEELKICVENILNPI